MLALLTLPLFFQGRLTNPGPGQPSLAINLAGPADWNTELPFVDLFRFTRPWVSQQDGKDWGQGPALSLDDKGWVKSLPAGAWAETFMTSYDTHYPAGKYVVLYDGEGTLTFGGGGPQGQSGGNGRIVVNVDPKKGVFTLQVRKVNPANYIRNIRVLMPGTEATYKTAPFTPTFLNRWRGVSAIRFMDWMNTNNSTVAKWSQRPKVDDSNWATKGIPAEVMIDLANRLNADAWFCIPHLADDDYVRSFATVAASSLKPGLRVYLEYSNEVWNGQFAQAQYAGQQGLAAKLGEHEWDAGWHWYAQRSTRMFSAWNSKFPRARTVRVLASQAGNAYVSDQILGFERAAQSADALAIAPYFGFTPGPNDTPSSDAVATWSLDRLFDHVRQNVVPEARKYMRDNKVVATKYHLPMIAYEGGQHLVGVQGGENNDNLTKLFTSANRDARMGEMYDAYLRIWKKEGGGLFGNFSSVGAHSKWGSWGQFEYADEPFSSSAKYQSLVRWAKEQGQSVGP